MKVSRRQFGLGLAASAVVRPIRACASSTNLVWVHTGDSISGCGTRWPFQYINQTSFGDCTFPASQQSATYIDGNILLLNMAISGSRLAGTNGVTSLMSPFVNPVVNVKKIFGLVARKYLLTCAIGSNDGAIDSYATPALYAAAVAAEMQVGRTAGFDEIVLCTLLPRGDGVMTEPNRLAYNSNLTNSSWRTANSIDGVLDLASDAIMGNPANLPVNNGGVDTYFLSDNVHPTPLGSGLLATNEVTPWMATILASLP
jgi:hypothetical protein